MMTHRIKSSNVVYRDYTGEFVKDPSIFKAGATYYMYYTAYFYKQGFADPPPRIGVATSTDRLHWTEQTAIIDTNGGGSGDNFHSRDRTHRKPDRQGL